MAEEEPGGKVLDLESTIDEQFAGAVNPLAAFKAAQKRPASGDLEGSVKTKFAKTLIEEYELLPEDEQGQLKWRGAPEDTFSDWTIEVVSEGPVPSAAPAPAPELASSGDITAGIAASTPAAKQPSSMISPSPMPHAAGATPATESTATPADKQVIEIQTQTQTFHVHRYFLGFGSRRSEYFAKLFREARGGVSRLTRTKLELEPLAAKAFPDLLDFVYDPRAPLSIETETATALHYLGVELEMTHLQHYAKQFCQRDLSLQNLEIYYQHAKIFEDKEIMDMIVEYIGKNISDISAHSNFVKHQTDSELWKRAFEHVTLSASNFYTDLHLSKLVAEFGMANADKLDPATFRELTSEDKIRRVDPDVAFTLCRLDDQFSVAGMEGEQEISSLQQRCATALAKTWKDLDATEGVVKDRTVSFLVDLLGKCLSEAKAENEKLTGKASRARSREVRSSGRVDKVEASSSNSGPASGRRRGGH